MKPVADHGYRCGHLIAMSPDVLARDIGAENLISVSISVEDQTGLTALPGVPEPTHTEENAQFQRHVESWKSVNAIESSARKVMYAKPATLNNTVNLFQPNGPTVISFQRATSRQLAVMEDKYKGMEKFPIS